MFRNINSPLKSSLFSAAKVFSKHKSGILKITLQNGPFGNLQPVIQTGDKVKKYSLLARDDMQSVYAPVAGVVKAVSEGLISISLSGETAVESFSFDDSDYENFLATTGVCGMGGSGFPASVKYRSGKGKIQSVIINGVECEPGVSIDRSVLLHEVETVARGALSLKNALEAREVVIAILRDKEFKKKLEGLYPGFKVIETGISYPAGAERLIIRSITKQDPPQGVLPFQLGFHIQNAVTVNSIGRVLQNRVPVVSRPLSVLIPSKGAEHNIYVSNGTVIEDIVEQFTEQPDNYEVIIAGGLMMGKKVETNDSTALNTTSLWLLKRGEVQTKYRDCIRCGACYDVCPLKLHPSKVFDLWFNEKTTNNALYTQIKECFLCGSCAAVCPANIPLVEAFREGKKCLKK